LLSHIETNPYLQALLNTGNSSAEIAATWIFDHPDLTLPDIPITVDEIEKLAGKNLNSEETQ
jgi:uncharacterized UBP type Zn finger protein